MFVGPQWLHAEPRVADVLLQTAFVRLQTPCAALHARDVQLHATDVGVRAASAALQTPSAAVRTAIVGQQTRVVGQQTSIVNGPFSRDLTPDPNADTNGADESDDRGGDPDARPVQLRDVAPKALTKVSCIKSSVTSWLSTFS